MEFAPAAYDPELFFLAVLIFYRLALSLAAEQILCIK